jgi:Divergent InlB B-repeat domain
MLVSRLSFLVRSGWARRLTLVLVVASCGLLSAAAPSNAVPGGLKVLVTGNCFAQAVTPLATAIQAQPGVSSVTTFDTSTGTPAAATLAAQDLVVSLGDDCIAYADQALWGNRLADFVDAGGVVLQAAYDNWDAVPQGDANPTGRFASGGYPPLGLGPNDNLATTLGQVLAPTNPIVQGLGTFPNSDNTTTPLAPGATLLAKWADGRNAIAVKGRVVATSSSADEASALPDLARLARNTGNYLVRHLVTVTKNGTGTGTVASSPAGISCGSSCSMRVAFGDSITLTATPASNSAFTGWTGACTGTGTCKVTDSGSDATATATFALIPPPDTKISKSSINSKKHKATFKFKAVGSGTSFQCELRKPHKQATFKACSSPRTYKHLKPGKYTFQVRALGVGGTDATPAKKKFKIKG